MKKLLTCLALLAWAFRAQAYELVATVSMDEDEKWHFDIELADNDIDFTAFQLDITLEGDAKLERKDLRSGQIMHRHSLMLAAPQGRYRLMGYSLSGIVFKEKEGPLFSFTLDGDIRGIFISGIFFIKPDGTKVEAAAGDDPDAQDAPEVVYDMKSRQVYRIDRRGICIRSEGNITPES